MEKAPRAFESYGQNLPPFCRRIEENEEVVTKIHRGGSLGGVSHVGHGKSLLPRYSVTGVID